MKKQGDTLQYVFAYRQEIIKKTDEGMVRVRLELTTLALSAPRSAD